MIISHSMRFVYVGPPKTASTSLHEFFTQPLLFDGRFDIDRREMKGQHDVQPPAEAAEYFVVMSTRFEPARVGSLWRHYRAAHSRGEEPLELSFREFLHWRKTAERFYAADLDAYRPERVDAELRFEHLAGDLAALPFVAPLVDQLQPLAHENWNLRYPGSPRPEKPSGQVRAANERGRNQAGDQVDHQRAHGAGN